MSQVNPAKLPKLHRDFTDVLSEMLQGEPLLDANGRAVLDDNSRPIYVRPTAAVLREVRTFLKDNGIDTEPVEGSPIREVSKQLKQYDEPLTLEDESQSELE